MKPAFFFRIQAILFILLFSSGALPAQSIWNTLNPRCSEVGQKFFRGEEKIQLYVPASFEGRTADEKRRVKGAELFEFCRFERQESKVKLRGRVSIFDFNYQRDRFDFQVHRSRKLRPGANICMDCHGGRAPRTTVLIGYEYTDLIPKPVQRGNIVFRIDEAHVDTSRLTVNHWLDKRIMLQGQYELGKVQQGRHHLAANAVKLGVSGILGHSLLLDGQFTASKLETYSPRRTLTGSLTYRFGKRLRLMVGGGLFLDGYSQFGTEMSEMGIITIGLEKDDPDLLPSLFDRLKNDQFGYVLTSLVYEYPF